MGVVSLVSSKSGQKSEYSMLHKSFIHVFSEMEKCVFTGSLWFIFSLS